MEDSVTANDPGKERRGGLRNDQFFSVEDLEERV